MSGQSQQGYYKVHSDLGVHFECMHEASAIYEAQRKCAETKGLVIPKIDYVPRAPVDHRGDRYLNRKRNKEVAP